MNKVLVVTLLNVYMAINDGCLSIVTYEHTYNDCHISELDLNLVYIRDKDNNLARIELDDIISVQFTDKAALVGMK